MVSGAGAPASRHKLAGVATVLYGVYWAGLTFLLLSPKLPRPPIPMDRRGLIAHLVTFAVLAAGCGIVCHLRGGLLNRRWVGGWLAVFAAYAMVTELIQPFVNRHADVLDWLANMGGVIIGMSVARAIVGKGSKIPEDGDRRSRN